MSTTDDGVDRGQLLVIIALLLGVVFVMLAVVVNSAVFAENLATRETVDTQRSSAYTAGIEPAVAARYDRTNAAGVGTAPGARTAFDDSLRTWADQRSDVAAKEGGLFRADWTTHVGWRLRQAADGAFGPADAPDAADWTLATGARNVSTFELDVTRESLHDGADTGAFHVVVDDGTTTWEIYLHRNASNDEIRVSRGDPSSPTAQCSRSTDRAVIDVRNGTVAGTDCGALDQPASLDGPLDVAFRNVQDDGTAQVEGTYTIVVNGSDAIATNATDHPARFNLSDGDPPTAAAVVYAVEYEASYDGGEIDHRRTVRYAPRAELR